MGLPPQSRLLQDAAERARRQVIARLSSHGDPTRFDGMFELSMTATRGHDAPAVIMKSVEKFRNLHVRKHSIGGRPEPGHQSLGERVAAESRAAGPANG